MIKIAVCDDENNYINTVEDYLDKFKLNYKDIEWDVFENGESLTRHYENNGADYDVIFLDMEMKRLNGIETANIIRQKNNHVIIVFITSHTKYMQKSFECSPFRFLIKPITYEDLDKVLNEVLIKLQQERSTFVFTENRAKVRLFCDDILFFESQSHWILINTKDKQYKILKPMSELEKQIDRNTFVSVHKSFIINLGYVNRINNNDVILHNWDKSIPISRNYKKTFIDEFFKFKERRYLI